VKVNFYKKKTKKTKNKKKKKRDTKAKCVLDKQQDAYNPSSKSCMQEFYIKKNPM
jgi:hypothetical protein